MKKNQLLLKILYGFCLAAIFCFGDFCAAADNRSIKRVKVRNQNGSFSQVDLYNSSHALIVAASRYSNGWSRLESIPGEMDLLEQTLKNKGFNVIRKNDPSGKELRDVFEDFIAEYGYDPDNRLLFFYSGHGHTRKQGSKGYLVPVDAPDPDINDQKKKSFLRKALPMTQIMAWARNIEAKHAVFFFDSCFSGTVFKQKDKVKPSKYINNLALLPVRQFFTAGSADEPVPAQSTFTPMVIDALKYGMADVNQDRYITGTELGMYLQQNVPKYTSQNPQYGKLGDYKYSRGDFIFLAGGPGPGASTSEPQPIKEKARLYVVALPDGSLVRILNIQEKYFDGIPLDKGRYKLEVSNHGYEKKVQWVTLGQSGAVDVEIKLQPLAASEPAGPPKPVLQTQPSPSPKRSFTEPVTGMEFVWVKGGCYQMGDTFGEGDSDATPVHRVCVDGFWLGKTEVTQGQWRKIMGSNPSHFKKGDNYPVERVSWNDCQAFIKKLNSRSGNRFRLPYEAEWEYGARSGGKKEKYAGSSSVDLVAWYGSNNGSKTHQVGTKTPNGLGLYDMSGNVWEWCHDWYGENYYSNSPQDNPHGPSGGTIRVLRGGSWNDGPGLVRAALRYSFSAVLRFVNRDDEIGFRLCRP